ncbi:MAG: hypothetical protein WBN83_12310, partial [Desulfoprunum sp.]
KRSSDQAIKRSSDQAIKRSSDQAIKRSSDQAFKRLFFQITLQQGVKFGQFGVGFRGLVFCAFKSAAFQVFHEFVDHDGEFSVLIEQIVGIRLVDVFLIKGDIQLAANLAAASLGNRQVLNEFLVAATFIPFGYVGHH